MQRHKAPASLEWESLVNVWWIVALVAFAAFHVPEFASLVTGLEWPDVSRSIREALELAFAMRN